MLRSPPSRRRGLKSKHRHDGEAAIVASFAEAWIEIQVIPPKCFDKLSPPSRRRGLKSFTQFAPMWDEDVASFAEAWIEIYLTICPELS